MHHRSPEEEALITKLIEVYRELIRTRYQYEILLRDGKLPDNVDKKIVDSVRNFFLNDVYPNAEKRKTIETAFETLGNYVNQPAKAMVLFGSMASAVFIFGRHLPAAINAGIITLKSFLDARNLENKILNAAAGSRLDEHLTMEDLQKCIVHIPQNELELFISNVQEMFLLMSNTELLDKTIRIMDMVVDKMKSKPKLYSKSEINGILLGKDILEHGLNIFKGYPDKIKNEIAQTIYNVEMSFINELYSNYKV
jgi:hypothetical protein